MIADSDALVVAPTWSCPTGSSPSPATPSWSAWRQRGMFAGLLSRTGAGREGHLLGCGVLQETFGFTPT